jgi:mono/diheme cytochrome c family protein
MRRVSLLTVLLGLGWAAAAPAADKAPSFTKEIKPLLAKYCVECHGAGKSKAGVNLSSYDDMMKSKKKVVVASKPDESKLFTTMNGTGKKMPPKNYKNQPTAKELALIKAWIMAGAKDDSGDAGTALPRELRPETVVVDRREPARRPRDEAAEE